MDNFIEWLFRVLCAVIITVVLVTCIGTMSCSRDSPKEIDITTVQTPGLQQLRNKYVTYLHLIEQKTDEHGFILTDHCDATLFSGLLGTVLDINVNLIAARRFGTEQWFRRPSQDCYPDHSRSTISRDMLLGVICYAWRTRDLPIINDLWAYGENNGWVMGEGDFTATFFTPAMQSILARVMYELGGDDHYVIRSIPIKLPEIFNHKVIVNSGRPVGFQAHLEVLGILLVGEVEGGLAAGLVAILKHHADRQPENALFLYGYDKHATGDYKDAIAILNSETLFPSSRLPTRKDHAEDWLWQRDFGADWLPSEDPSDQREELTGGDFLFVAALILGEY